MIEMEDIYTNDKGAKNRRKNSLLKWKYCRIWYFDIESGGFTYFSEDGIRRLSNVLYLTV